MELFPFSVYIKLQTEFVAFSQLYLSSNQLISSIELDKPPEHPHQHLYVKLTKNYMERWWGLQQVLTHLL